MSTDVLTLEQGSRILVEVGAFFLLYHIYLHARGSDGKISWSTFLIAITVVLLAAIVTSATGSKIVYIITFIALGIYLLFFMWGEKANFTDLFVTTLFFALWLLAVSIASNVALAFSVPTSRSARGIADNIRFEEDEQTYAGWSPSQHS